MNISWITKTFCDVGSSFQEFWCAGTGSGVYGKNISKKLTSSKEERTDAKQRKVHIEIWSIDHIYIQKMPRKFIS